MSAPSLAFLETFYTNVTLYAPAEPAPATAPEEAPPAVAAAPRAAATASATAPVIAPILVTPISPVVVPVPPARLPAAALASPEPETPTAPPPAPAGAPVASPHLLTPFSTLGDNPNGIIMLVRLPHDQFVKLPRNVFLNKMLQALGLVMADVVLVNVESHLVVALTSLRRELAATHIIAFGRDLLDVALRTTQIYEPVQFPSLGLSYLSSATVDSVEYDVSLKKRLWPGLQRMFL